MSIAPFKNDKELKAFARKFFASRVETFRKDIVICMTPNASRQHAYFPALSICISFANLLAGLHAGTLRSHGPQELNQLKQYAADFMKAEYTSDRRRLEILYEGLRNKIAHLAYPYVVFDTNTKLTTFQGQPRRRVTWAIHSSKPRPTIKITDHPTKYLPKKNAPPWPVPYDCVIDVSIRGFAKDIVSSIYGRSGYFRRLRSNPDAQKRFAECMKDYYPQ
jgi:hypothetical protein